MRQGTFRLALVALPLLTAQAFAQAPSTDEARIHSLIAAHQQASERSDLRGLVDLYAADAELVFTTGRIVRGHDAIEAYYRASLETPTARSGRHHTHPTETIKIRLITPDVAPVDVESVNVGGMDSTGTTLPAARSLLATVWRKQSGAWTVVQQRSIAAPRVAP